MTGKHHGPAGSRTVRRSRILTIAVLGLAILTAVAIATPANQSTRSPRRSGAPAPPAHTTAAKRPSPSGTTLAAADQPWLKPPVAHLDGHLRAGSHPAVLPSDLLIVDKLNNRLIVVDPEGRIRWQFPQPGDLAAGQKFLIPDDAFFTPDGKYIIATQEDRAVITLIDIAQHRIPVRAA